MYKLKENIKNTNRSELHDSYLAIQYILGTNFMRIVLFVISISNKAIVWISWIALPNQFQNSVIFGHVPVQINSYLCTEICLVIYLWFCPVSISFLFSLYSNNKPVFSFQNISRAWLSIMLGYLFSLLIWNYYSF